MSTRPPENAVVEPRPPLLRFAAFFVALLALAYANHFQNGFYFDDYHTIVNNEYIRDLGNFPLFFTETATFGTMPDNQGYRPVVTTLNAIDFRLGGGDSPDPLFFHVSIFFWYLVQLGLMFFVFKWIFDLSRRRPENALFALFGVAFYAMHASHAETINYIIARSDSFSTLCVVAALFMYQVPATRRFLLYLIPAAIGVQTKQTGVMFAPLLYFYIVLFEEKISIIEAFALWRRPVLRSIVKSAPAFVVCAGGFALQRAYFFPGDVLGDEGSRWHYFATQWEIIVHYLGNFLLPIRLSVDYDFKLVPALVDPSVLLSLGVLLALGITAIVISRKPSWRPFSYGLVWFFVALAPTSSFVVVSQLANDHRVFFPDVGLALGATWLVWMAWERLRTAESSRTIGRALAVVATAIIAAHAYGTHQRNEVWHSPESLWFDAVRKAPDNGRVQMNYGLTQMAKGNYADAERYFERALELLPRWAYSNINMGVLQNAMGRPERAETYFLNAISFQPRNADAHYRYALFLNNRLRHGEALRYLETAAALSPGHSRVAALLPEIRSRAAATREERAGKLAGQIQSTDTAQELVDLGQTCYRSGEFELAIRACKKAIEIDPDNAKAYNNMCAAFCSLKKWTPAIAACNKALELLPDFQLARNNLRWATNGLSQAVSEGAKAE